MDKAHYLARFRKESPVFNPQVGNVYKPYIQPGDVDSMNSYLLGLTGGSEEKGQFYDPNKKTWETALIPRLEAALAQIPERFQQHKQMELNRGNPPLSSMPAGLIEEKEKLEAQLHVAREEAEFLEKEIAAVKDAKKPLKEPIFPYQWGAQTTNRDGIVDSIAGLPVSPDPTGLLRINDKRSRFNGMPVWMFKAQIFRPLSWENSFRLRTEELAAKAEKRPPRRVPYPKPGEWNPKTETVAYPSDYDPATLKKCLKYKTK